MPESNDHRKQVLFRASPQLHKRLQARAVEEERDMSEILNDALVAYLGTDATAPTEADRYCNKLRKFMGKKVLSDGEKTGLNMIVFLLDLWVKG